jgi:hypothetical protein
LEPLSPSPAQPSCLFSDFYEEAAVIDVTALMFRHVRLVVSGVERLARLDFG